MSLRLASRDASLNINARVWVATGGYPPAAPANPYVRALAHTVLPNMGWPALGQSIDLPCHSRCPGRAMHHRYMDTPLDVDASGVVPGDDSMFRRPLPSTGWRSRAALPVSSVLPDAKTPSLSSRRASHSFAWRYCGCVGASLPGGDRHTAAGPGCCFRRPSKHRR